MNRLEAKRYAHRLAAECVRQYLDAGAPVLLGEDGPLLAYALRAVEEQHRRFGPKTTDRLPRAKQKYETPLLDERALEQGTLTS